MAPPRRPKAAPIPPTPRSAAKETLAGCLAAWLAACLVARLTGGLLACPRRWKPAWLPCRGGVTKPRAIRSPTAIFGRAGRSTPDETSADSDGSRACSAHARCRQTGDGRGARRPARGGVGGAAARLRVTRRARACRGGAAHAAAAMSVTAYDAKFGLKQDARARPTSLPRSGGCRFFLRGDFLIRHFSSSFKEQLLHVFFSAYLQQLFLEIP